MLVSSDVLAPAILWIGHGAFWSVVVLAALTAARAELGDALRNHVFPATVVAVLVVWQVRAPTPVGPSVHLLGATVMTVLFGWRLAILGLTVVLAGTALSGDGGWSALGVNGVTAIAVPVGASVATAWIVRRFLPPNPFAFIFGAGFAAGWISMVSAGLASGLWLLAGSPIPWHGIVEQYLVGYLLLPYGEAFLTGGVVAWLVAYYPHWVREYRAPYPPVD